MRHTSEDMATELRKWGFESFGPDPLAIGEEWSRLDEQGDPGLTWVHVWAAGRREFTVNPDAWVIVYDGEQLDDGEGIERLFEALQRLEV